MARTMPESIVVRRYRDDGRCVLLKGFTACTTKPSTVLVGLAAIDASFPRVTAQTLR
jgi:hypothetical protein